jgi:hypothetical protein
LWFPAGCLHVSGKDIQGRSFIGFAAAELSHDFYPAQPLIRSGPARISIGIPGAGEGIVHLDAAVERKW